MREKGGVMRAERGGRSVGVGAAEALVAIGVLGLLASAVSGPRRDRAERVCLGNIKQICGAIRMYLADYNRLPARDASEEAMEYFAANPGRLAAERPGEGEERRPMLIRVGRLQCMYEANPYLRWPVILDPYLKDRSVWRCPNALLERPAAFMVGTPDWLGHLRAHERDWGMGKEFCIAHSTWPPGWGGEVTDSLIQRKLAADPGPTAEAVRPGVFVQSIAVNTGAAGKKVRQLGDPAWFVICADGGAQVERMSTGTLAYPDICALECANEVYGWADWEECTWAADCGLYNHAPSDGSFLRNVELRRPYARHRGGVNIGFLDGHAGWFDSEEVIALSPSECDPDRGRLRGYMPWGPTSDCGFAEDNPGVPTLY